MLPGRKQAAGRQLRDGAYFRPDHEIDYHNPSSKYQTSDRRGSNITYVDPVAI
jgi:hypothetical protein